MSVKDCLAKLVATGAVSKEAANAARGLWERYQGRFSLDLPPAQAEAAAALQAARELAQGTKRQRYSVAVQVQRQTAAEQAQMAHPWGPSAGAMSILTRDIYRLGGANVDTRAQTLREALYARFNAGMEAYGSKLLGLKQDLAGIRNMVREVFGVDTGDAAAKAAAAGWTDATRFANDYVIKAGKVFEPNEDWRFPQFWSSDRVRKFGMGEELKADLNREIASGGLKVFDKQNFEIATDAARIKTLVDKAARDIITEAGAPTPFSKEMRTFLFQPGSEGAEAFLRLQGKYGAGQDIMSVLRNHLNAMAQDMGMIDILGPQHAATARMLLTNARQWEALGKPGQGAFRPQRWIGLEGAPAIQRTYDVLSGRANGAESTFWAGALGATRSLLTASSLGSSVVPAVIGDSVTMLLASKWNGMSFGKVLGRTIEAMSTNNPALKEDAARLLVTAHAMSDHAIGVSRYADQLVGPKVLRRVADFVLRTSGLNAWTEGAKKAFTMEFLGYVARMADRDAGAVDKPFSDFLKRYGIKSDEWDALRARPLTDIRGAKYFDSSAAANDPAVRKLFEGILTERSYAVLEPDARVRGMVGLGTNSGTFIGQVARSLTMFQSFSMTMIATHLMNLAIRDGTIASKTLNAIGFMALHIAAGAAIVQARQLLQGKDPIDFSNPKFWFQAATQGGGLGYYGDLIGGATQASDRSQVAKLAGPVAGLIDDTARAGYTTATKGWAGQPGKGIGPALNVLKTITPGQNLWFSRIATDRLLFDQLHRAIDPDYAQGFARQQQRAMKSYNQQSWWQPGETAPSRAPKFVTVQ